MRHDGPCELRRGGWHYAVLATDARGRVMFDWWRRIWRETWALAHA